MTFSTDDELPDDDSISEVPNTDKPSDSEVEESTKEDHKYDNENLPDKPNLEDDSVN